MPDRAKEDAVSCETRQGTGQRIGVMGGSFDPIHRGHVAAAEETAERMWFDRLILMPTGTSPHKPSGACASAHDRLAMVRAAVEGHPVLEVSDIETRRSGITYTIDTIRELADELGENTELSLVLGTDTVRDLPSWRNVEGILAIAHPVVIERPGQSALDWRALNDALPEGLGARLCECVITLTRGVSISSTEIRRSLARGEAVTGLVPSAVERYITEHGLYRDLPD